MASRRFFFGLSALAVALMVLAFVFAGVRFDTGAKDPAAPSSQERKRQALAEKSSRISDAAKRLATNSPSSNVFARISTTAAHYATSLGGVWRPWPKGAPSGRTNPPVSISAPDSTDAAGLSRMLGELSNEAASAANSAPAEQRRTYLAVALDSRLRAIDVAARAGGRASCGKPDPVAAGKASATQDALLGAEAARQWLETSAASLPGHKRSAEIARLDSIKAMQSAMISSGAKDERRAVVPIPTLGKGETLTNAALTKASDSLLRGASTAGKPDGEATVSYACSLYLTPKEREGAEALLRG